MVRKAIQSNDSQINFKNQNLPVKCESASHSKGSVRRIIKIGWPSKDSFLRFLAMRQKFVASNWRA